MNRSRKQKVSAWFIAIMIVAVVASGCSNGNNNSDGQSADHSQSASQQPASSPSADAGSETQQPAELELPLDPPVTISTFGCDTGSEMPKGDTIENNVFTRWAKEKLGVEIKFVWIAPVQDNACTNKMMLDLASGKELPDVITSFDFKMLEQFVATGQFQELKTSFDQYASDTVKVGYEQHPEVWNAGKIDGQQMIMPLLNTAYQNDPVLWIRKDWMEKLGLQPPKTMSELERMMEAFKTSDPDGNGKKDTIPLALALKESYANMMGDAEWILGNYGALSGYGSAQGVWLKNGDQLVNGGLQPEIKQGLGKLKEWIDKGYVDKEAAMHNTFDAGKLFTSGNAAIIPAAYWTPRWPFSSDFTDPKAVYEAYPLPTGDDGKAMHLTSSIVGSGVIVNKNFKRLDALYALINRSWEYSNPQPGSEFEYGFAEGYDYKKNADGTVTYDFEPKYEPIAWGLFVKPQQPDLELHFYSQYLKGEAQPQNAQQQAWVNDKLPLKAGAIAYDARESAVPNMYNGPETPTMKDKGELLKKIVMDGYTKIIYGNEPISYFDELVAEYNKQGGDKLAQEVNDWYSKNK